MYMEKKWVLKFINLVALVDRDFLVLIKGKVSQVGGVNRIQMIKDNNHLCKLESL